MDSDEPYVTKTGKVLSDAEIEALSAEAERGYDIERLARIREATDDGRRYTLDQVEQKLQDED